MVCRRRRNRSSLKSMTCFLYRSKIHILYEDKNQNCISDTGHHNSDKINKCCVGQTKVYDDDSSAGLCGAAECERKSKSDPNLKCTAEEMENHNNYCTLKNTVSRVPTLPVRAHALHFAVRIQDLQRCQTGRPGN